MVSVSPIVLFLPLIGLTVSCWVCVSGNDESNTSNYLRSSSPEYDEVILTDNIEEEDEPEEKGEGEELSQEIPIITQRSKLSNQDKDDGAVLFDDSESNEFSLPPVDWSCIESSSQDVNNDGTLSLGPDKAITDADQPSLSTELREITDASQHEVINSTLTSNAANVDKSKDYRFEVSEGDTSMSEGLVFNTCNADHFETTLKAAEDSPVVHLSSRLSRKRSRIPSKDKTPERVQCKRLNTSVYTESGSAMEQPVCPRPQPVAEGNADIISSSAESSSEPVSFAAETTVVSSGSGTPMNMLSRHFTASFSQGTQCSVL